MTLNFSKRWKCEEKFNKSVLRWSSTFCHFSSFISKEKLIFFICTSLLQKIYNPVFSHECRSMESCLGTLFRQIYVAIKQHWHVLMTIKILDCVSTEDIIRDY